jgi:hypothetical protein
LLKVLAPGVGGATIGETIFAYVYIREIFKNLLRNHWARQIPSLYGGFLTKSRIKFVKIKTLRVHWGHYQGNHFLNAIFKNLLNNTIGPERLM